MSLNLVMLNILLLKPNNRIFNLRLSSSRLCSVYLLIILLPRNGFHCSSANPGKFTTHYYINLVLNFGARFSFKQQLFLSVLPNKHLLLVFELVFVRECEFLIMLAFAIEKMRRGTPKDSIILIKPYTIVPKAGFIGMVTYIID